MDEQKFPILNVLKTNYEHLSSEATYDSSQIYYIYQNDTYEIAEVTAESFNSQKANLYLSTKNWIPIPAIKGTSVNMVAEPTIYPSDTSASGWSSDYPYGGYSFEIYDEKSNQTTEIKIKNGTIADVNSLKIDGNQVVDGVVNLYAVSYASGKTLNDAQQSQARVNIGAVPTFRTINGQSLNNDISLTANNVGAVPIDRTINGQALTSNITLTVENIGAVPTSRTINGQALNSNINLTASNVGAVPTDRTINNQSLNSNITLNPGHIGAVNASLKINGMSIVNATQSDASITTRLIKENVNVSCSAWTTDSSYSSEGYNYRAGIPWPGVTSSMVPNVIFNMADSISGTYAPVTATSTDLVYIYASSLPGVVETVTGANFSAKIAEGIYIINENNLYTEVTDSSSFDSAATYYKNITTTIPTIICFT